MSKKLEQKHLSFEIKAANEDGKRTFRAYATTFGNEDSYGDIIDFNAFDESILKIQQSGKMPKLFYQHDRYALPGVITKVEKDDKGVIVEGEFIDTSLGRDVYEEVKSGAIQEMSVGFWANEVEFLDEGGRIIKKADWVEVSFVTFPANSQAEVLSVKSKIKCVKDFERFLRDAGFSRKEAKAITAEGYNAILDQRDADVEEVQEGQRDADLFSGDEVALKLDEINNFCKGVIK